jgi:hypothetical protein
MKLRTLHAHNVVNPNPAHRQRIGDERPVTPPFTADNSPNESIMRHLAEDVVLGILERAVTIQGFLV